MNWNNLKMWMLLPLRMHLKKIMIMDCPRTPFSHKHITHVFMWQQASYKAWHQINNLNRLVTIFWKTTHLIVHFRQCILQKCVVLILCVCVCLEGWVTKISHIRMKKKPTSSPVLFAQWILSVFPFLGCSLTI